MQAALGSRSRLRAHARGGVPPLRRWGALRTEPPLRVTSYAVRFKFASFSTYRKGSPTCRRAFSAYVNSLYMRHADDARGGVPHDRLADDARGGVPPLQRLGGASRTEPPLRMSAKPLRFGYLRLRRDSYEYSPAKIYLARSA